jgi:tRNA threonylcarbamoyladenosine biosynthesis protein TsaB
MNHYLLHIETATKVCSVALSLNGVEVALKEVSSDKFIHSENLNLFIEEVLLKGEIDIRDLRAISFSSGPGSYTGLRIGTSTVKGLCYGLEIPLIAIPTLDALFYLAKEKYRQQNICVMLDARRMEVYSQIWDKNASVIKSLSADILDEHNYNVFQPFVCVGDGCDKMKSIWISPSIQFDSAIQPSATGQIKIAYMKYLNCDFVDMVHFVPNYLKEFHSVGFNK